MPTDPSISIRIRVLHHPLYKDERERGREGERGGEGYLNDEVAIGGVVEGGSTAGPEGGGREELSAVHAQWPNHELPHVCLVVALILSFAHQR